MGYTISGYIVSFNRNSNLLSRQERGKLVKFFEKVAPGAFRKSLQSGRNISLVVNHEGESIASTKDRTLELWEDNIGLRYRATINHAETIKAIKDGLIHGCSFAFTDHTDIEEYSKSILPIKNRVLQDLKLTHVSLIKEPRMSAYKGTTVEISDENQRKSDLVNNIDQVKKYKYAF